MKTSSSQRSAVAFVPADVVGLLGFLAVVILAMSLASSRFFSADTFVSVAFQLPELGLFTLAMLMPLISGGFNLAVTFTANISGLAMAWVLHAYGGADAGAGVIVLGIAAALATGAASGWVMGAIIARTGASPILVSLSMMIFLRGLGEFLTHGGDISGFPPAVLVMGNGLLLGVPVPLWIFAGCAAVWHVVMTRSRLGFATRMIGSNLEATRYASGRKNHIAIEINGSKGSLYFDFEDMNRLKYFNVDDPKDRQGFRDIIVTQRDNIQPYVSNWWPPGHGIGYEHTFVHTIADFVNACVDGKSVQPTFEDGLKNQRVLAAVEESSQKGKWVKVPG